MLGVLLPLATSLSWGVANVLIQRSGRAVGAPRALFWALLTGGALCASSSLVLESPSERVHALMDLEVAGSLALASASGLMAYVGMFFAFERAPLAIAVPIVSSWALVACLIAVVLLGQPAGGPGQLAGGAIVFAGVLAVSVGSGRGEGVAVNRGTTTVGPVFAALAASIGFGVMVSATGLVAARLGSLTTIALVYLSIVLLGLPIALLRGVSLAPPPRGRWPLVLATAVSEAAGFVFVSLAPRYAPMTVVAPLSSLAATFTVAYAWLVLHERQPPHVVIGAILACVGVVVIAS
ncbi:MAG: DMT family transporter [Nannocystaceae bacterium]